MIKNSLFRTRLCFILTDTCTCAFKMYWIAYWWCRWWWWW